MEYIELDLLLPAYHVIIVFNSIYVSLSHANYTRYNDTNMYDLVCPLSVHLRTRPHWCVKPLVFCRDVTGR